MSYVLLCALRRIGLHDTDFATATCGTIRLKLLKIGAVVRFSVRRIRHGIRLSGRPRLAPRRHPARDCCLGPRLAGMTRAAATRNHPGTIPRLTEIIFTAAAAAAKVQPTPRLQTPQTAARTKLRIIPLSNPLDHGAVV
jgi:hypothetical protein